MGTRGNVSHDPGYRNSQGRPQSRPTSAGSYGGSRPPSAYSNSSHPGSVSSVPGSVTSAHSRPRSTASDIGTDYTTIEPNKKKKDKVSLKKELGLWSAVSLVVGTIIGSGIFISPKEVTEGAGSVGTALIIWVLGGVISLGGALSYAELGTFIPLAGAEYSYMLSAFRPLNERVGCIPAFLFAWTNMVVLKPATVAIITLAFGAYVTEPFFEECASVSHARKCMAAVAILVLTVINCWSVRAATWVQNIFTVAKIIAIIIIVIAGFVNMGKGNTQYLSTGFKGREDSTLTAGGIVLAFYGSMWAYDGWNTLNYVTEEVINPKKVLPLSIWIGIPIVAVCYLLVNVSYFTVMSVDDMIDSHAVAFTWGRRSLGVMSWIIPVFVACSTLGAANGTLFSSGRLNYAAAREGHMVEVLSMLHVKKCTPLPALIFTAIMALIYIIPGDIESLISFFSFAVWLFYGSTMVALLVMRYTMRGVHRPYKVPIVLPIFILVVSIFLVFVPIVTEPRWEYLYVALFILSGLILYIPFVHFQVQPGCMDAVTAFLQRLMDVSLPSDPNETAC